MPARERLAALQLASGLVAAAVVVLLVVVFALIRHEDKVPPPPAVTRAGSRAVSPAEVTRAVASALRSVRTLKGVLVLVQKESPGASLSEMRWEFATTSWGDFRMRGTNSLANGEKRYEDLAYDSETGVERSYSEEGDVRSARERTNLGAGPPDPSADGWLLERWLAAVTRALAAAKDPKVVADRYEGRDVWILDTPLSPDLLAAYSADRMRMTVDRHTGFPLRVIETSKGDLVRELRLMDLEPDVGLPRADFTFDFPLETTAESVDCGYRRVEAEELRSAVGYEPLMPGWMPDGYELAMITVSKQGRPTGKEGGNPPTGGIASMAYRRGFDRIVVSTRWTGGRPELWSDPLASGEGMIDRPEKVTLARGAYQGAEAELLIDARSVPHLWAVGKTLMLTVSGDLTRDELVRVAESLERRAE